MYYIWYNYNNYIVFVVVLSINWMNEVWECRLEWLNIKCLLSFIIDIIC